MFNLRNCFTTDKRWMSVDRRTGRNDRSSKFEIMTSTSVLNFSIFISLPREFFEKLFTWGTICYLGHDLYPREWLLSTQSVFQ
jgi:hypothetical protein